VQCSADRAANDSRHCDQAPSASLDGAASSTRIAWPVAPAELALGAIFTPMTIYSRISRRDLPRSGHKQAARNKP
jgi:hypothetical protein